MLAEFQELDAYRLEKDWTWHDVWKAMHRAHCAIPIKTLHYLMRTAGNRTTPRDRTVYKVRKFLVWVEDNDPAALKRSKVIAARIAANLNGDNSGTANPSTNGSSREKVSA